MEIKHRKAYQTVDIVTACDDGIYEWSVCVRWGDDRVCKSETDALEAAEILKQFFEAKEAGKVARLVVESDDAKNYCADCIDPVHCYGSAGKCDPAGAPKLQRHTPEPPKVECFGCRCVVDDECQKRGLCWFDPANKWESTPIAELNLEGQRHKNTVIDQMNQAQPNGDALKEFADCCKDDAGEKIAGLIWGNRANDMTVEQYTAFTIAHNATQIFVHGGYTSHAAAVDDAAEIWRLAQRIEI